MNNINKVEDMNAAMKLEMKDPETYSTLCIMHLSFLLDLSNEELEIILESKNKNITNEVNDCKSKKDKENICGSPLTHEGVCRVYQLIAYLGKDYNIRQIGIFRKTGNVNKQQLLKSVIYNGTEIDLDSSEYGVHDCASVLKYFLSDLPEPLLTEAHFHAHCQIAVINTIAEAVKEPAYSSGNL
ncbi:rho GTPase-activating protein 19-like [Centruroides sculpturatus]|uniref:rho GTPase-activating protein 19-like n=1 Tax=Centruroides sculpturatus TaxID=218467 RepID=UPI000C6C91DE|nr:rho GTPase-activating protein 19-like [Centruroides sculpturatus]XP_023216966.1 rho GTPase-activating protein 19-like [Centruroides sculpturatus]